MKRLILIVVAMAFAAVFGGTTNLDASPPKGSSHGASHTKAAGPAHVAVHGRVAVHANATDHAHRTLLVYGRSVHVPVHGRGYGGWASRCWLPSYRTYGYYSGAEQVWYYWYAPLNEYLPITYMSVYPPTPMGVAPVGLSPVTPGLPAALPMSSELPPGATLAPGPITAP
jgi:hypothetical protein